MSSPTPTKCPFPDVRRVVTGHTPTGKSTVLADTIQPPTSWSPDSVNPKFDLYYTGSAPASIDSEITQGKWVDEIADHPEILSADGSTFRAFEFAPGSFSPLHRTVSLDYGIVAKGSVVLELEDGERVTLNAGDTVIQRGTMHCWRNETAEWARMYFVGLGAKPVNLNGKELEEEWHKAAKS
ncbi:hypothetical protein B0H13DRAFT_1706799 [Mycena leptocephala]|nr:hypothetical protein B0H13DRAFT_1706799 [Mycena leptocephala]